ncbi:MAG: hypothetical protein U5L04_01525 [Trueperaceae bacterium]|nr:hypothetical protein [Trueperaceae bacterium]
MSTQDKKMVGRFIHTLHGESDLPTTWTYPGLDEMEGAQTLRLSRVLEIVEQDDDSRDDWFGQSHREGHLAILTVTGFSGDTKPLKYRAITEDDVVEMHVINYSSLDWELTEIAIELDDEGHEIDFDEMGFPQGDWMYEVGEDVVIERLVERMEKVEPRWVDRVPEHMTDVA